MTTTKNESENTTPESRVSADFAQAEAVKVVESLNSLNLDFFPAAVTKAEPAPVVTDGDEKDAIALAEFALKVLATARAELDAIHDQVEQSRQQWEAQNRDLLDALAAKRLCVEQAENDTRNAAVKAYELTGDKKGVEHVEIKMEQVVEVDPLAAETWLRSNMPAFLRFDPRVYQKVFRETSAVKFLHENLPNMPGEIVEKPKAYIASDLSALLEEKHE